MDACCLFPLVNHSYDYIIVMACPEIKLYQKT